jgi:hypothetical protein
MNRLRSAYAVTVLLLAVCVAAAGAGKYGKKTLIGSWEFDMIKMYEEAMKKSGQETPPGMDLEAMLEGSYMRITFKKDGSYVFESKAMQQEQKESGKWEVVEEGDNQVTVKSVSESGEEMQVTMTFTDEDTFSALMVEGEDEMTMHATRIKAKKGKGKTEG